MLDFLSKWKTYLGVGLIILLVIFIGVREYQHNQQISTLKQELTEAQGTTTTNQPAVTKVTDGTNAPTPAQISGAGNIDANQANEFAKQVASREKAINLGKADPEYTYTVNGDADQAISQLNSQLASGTAPKEVQQADFVTVSKITDTGGGTTNTATASSTSIDKATTSGSTSANDSAAVIQTTVKVNSYYNYQPSVYFVPQAYPDTGKRADLVYTNRDFLFDVNYDADRDGNKAGVSVGYRIAKW